MTVLSLSVRTIRFLPLIEILTHTHELPSSTNPYEDAQESHAEIRYSPISPDVYTGVRTPFSTASDIPS